MLKEHKISKENTTKQQQEQHNTFIVEKMQYREVIGSIYVRKSKQDRQREISRKSVLSFNNTEIKSELKAN